MNRSETLLTLIRYMVFYERGLNSMNIYLLKSETQEAFPETQKKDDESITDFSLLTLIETMQNERLTGPATVRLRQRKKKRRCFLEYIELQPTHHFSGDPGRRPEPLALLGGN